MFSYFFLSTGKSFLYKLNIKFLSIVCDAKLFCSAAFIVSLCMMSFDVTTESNIQKFSFRISIYCLVLKKNPTNNFFHIKIAKVLLFGHSDLFKKVFKCYQVKQRLNALIELWIVRFCTNFLLVHYLTRTHQSFNFQFPQFINKSP